MRRLMTASGIAATVVVASLIGCGGGASLPAGSDVDEHVIVHPVPSGERGRCTVSTTDPTSYALTGWRLPPEGLSYRINPNQVRTPLGYPLTPNAIVNAIKDAFAAWSAANSNLKFTYAGMTRAQAGRLDSINTVSWRSLAPGTLAVTYVWVSRLTGRVVEADTAFNNRYAWYDFAIPSGATADNYCPESPLAYDIRNIATHEFGHWCGLDDLYNDTDKDATMYGYGEPQELKKRTLATGDRDGALAVTP